MEYKNKEISLVHDDPCEGKTFITPQCVSCEHNENGFCKLFNKRRIMVIADKDANVFDCEHFKSKW